MKLLTFFTILTLTQGLKVKQYQKTKVASFQVIKTTPQPQSTLHCSFLCKNELTCEGFQLDDNTCKTLKNVNLDQEASEPKNVWVDHDKLAIKTKLLVMTGQPLENGIKTEVIDLIDPQNHCITTDFPLGLWDSMGGLLGTDLPIICGGDADGTTIDTCYALLNRQFVPKMTLSSPREETGRISNVIFDGSLMLVAGFAQEGSSLSRSGSVEAVSLTGNEQLPDLPTAVGSPCTVKIDDKRIMTIGGHDGSTTKTTFIYDFDTKEWGEGPELANTLAGHACAKFNLGTKSIIAVASGYSSHSVSGRIPDVEFLEIGSNNGWIKGPDLPVSLNQHNMVPTPDGQGVLVIGGDIGSDEVQDSIYQLKCTSTNLDSCFWITLEQKLKYAREAFVAMLIPDSLAQDLCQ